MDVDHNTHQPTIRFAFTLDASDSMAGTGENAAQVLTFPLVIKAIENPVL